MDGEYRYRLIVINNSGRQAKEFKGTLQLQVKVRHGGKDAMIVFPSSRNEDSKIFHFEIKHFHRLEGVFSVPPGADVLGVEARLVQDGVARAKQFLTF